MASIGHVAIGMAAARVDRGGTKPAWTSMARWAALSLLPDIDVVGFSLGVAYADPFGHRGATHSLFFAAAIGAAFGLVARRYGHRFLHMAGLGACVVASHPLVDMATDGGLGCALFWPFSDARYFAPWRPIPVAPIGLDLFSPHNGYIVVTEVLLFGPVLIYALWPRLLRRKLAAAGLASAWLATIWLTSSTDPARERIVGLVVREDTAYASGFSDSAFRSIKPGASIEDVRRLVGAPVGESWFYPSSEGQAAGADTAAASVTDDCRAVRFESGVVVAALARDACTQRGITDGLTRSEVERQLGSPAESCWRYTWSPRNRRHRVRMICFVKATVDSVILRWD